MAYIEEASTRCDMYVGVGQDVEWVGSVGCDGHPEEMGESLLLASSETDFRAEVDHFLRTDISRAISPRRGWPWPWKTSANSDFAICFDNGEVLVKLNDHLVAVSDARNLTAEYNRTDDEAALASGIASVGRKIDDQTFPDGKINFQTARSIGAKRRVFNQVHSGP